MKYQLTDIRPAYDGDTFTARFIVNGKQSDPMRIRIHGIDCPEIKAISAHERKLAVKARDITRKALEGAQTVATVRGVDAFDRVLCDVSVDGESLKRILIDSGLAKSYEGSKRKW